MQASFSFDERIIGIFGKNGQGKTNLLDAIHYLCFTKSYFSKIESQQVLNGAQGFRIEGRFITNGHAATVSCVLRENGKKEFLVDGLAYDRFADHIGKLPCVFIAPDDVQIITGGSEERRRYVDALLCQLNAEYLLHLMSYNRVLQQRNSYLRALDGDAPDHALLDVYDGQLLSHGNYVFEQRQLWLGQLVPLVLSSYKRIAGEPETVMLTYQSALLNNSFEVLLQQNRARDISLQRTTTGIHRDDLELVLNNVSFKTIASQGQRKSLLFALKLAEFELLKTNKQFPPLLLLDDVFEKLDAVRMHNLLHCVCVENQGQVFITDTHFDRLKSALEGLEQAYQLIGLADEQKGRLPNI